MWGPILAQKTHTMHRNKLYNTKRGVKRDVQNQWKTTFGEIQRVCILQKPMHNHRAQALAPVVQTMDSAIHRINHYRPNKHKQNHLSYPVNSDLSGG